MIKDRYVPDSDDEYEPAPSPRHRDSHRSGKPEGNEQHRSSKPGSHKSSKERTKERSGSHRDRSKERQDKHDKPKATREASFDDVEDGEIVDAEGDASPAAHAAAAAGITAAANKGTDKAGLTTADAAANGHRYPAEGAAKEGSSGKGRGTSPLGSPDSKQPSSKPPSGKRDRSRDHSRERSRRDRDCNDEKQRSSRDRSKEKTKERSSSHRDRSKEKHRQDRSRDRSREVSRDRSRDHRRDTAAEPPPRRPSSSRDADVVLPPPPRERSSSRQRGKERSSSRQRADERSSSRQRHDDSRRLTDDSRRGGSSRYGSDAGGRPGPEQRQPMGYEERQRLRERERGGDGDSRKRRSRSRSRSRQDWRGRDDDRSYKRSRDEGHERRHSSPEVELDLDPNALLETDALGLSKAEKEAEEEAKRLEESRRRRQAILAKHQQAAAVAAPTATAAAEAAAAAGEGAGDQQQPQEQQQPEVSQPPPQQQQQPQPGTEGAADGDASPAAAAAPAPVDGTATPEGERSSSEDSHNAPGSPVMDIWNAGQPSQQGGEGDEASSRPAGPEELTSQLPVHMVVPGTEPNMQSERLRVAMPNAAAGGGINAGAAATAAAAGDGGDDMFADDDDMFAEAGGEVGGGGVRRGPVVPAGLMDNYDDPEGYYNFQVGEVLDNRYEVFACKGKGVFSTVLRARDKLKLVPNPVTGIEEFAEVAIKVIRSNETMAKAAALEQRILRMLADKDPDNRKHVIRMLRTFEYRHHVCMVFEPMDMNLRELTLKYGRNVGLNITAVGVYAAQLLVALRHLHQCSVLHADIKPDNILVNARRSKVKICDLGSAMLAGENERTPYLVSRFYRSPEVILGLAYDFPMDMWSVGCVLYELFTGKILFPGRTNNEMLKLMMDVKGPFPKKMLKKGIFVEKHFEPDAQLSFSLVEEDPVTKQPVRRVITNPTIKHNFLQLLARAEGDKQQVAQLADLLEKMLALDPEKRISADNALRHDFVKPFLPKKKAGGKH